MTQPLSRLLKPKSIAVIGGGYWGNNIIEQCRKLGFKGPIYPVHPKAKTVGGEPAFKSLADLPQAPDASFVGVNRSLTIEIVAQLSAMGAGGAVCFASGFAEASAEIEGSDDLQAQLLAAAGQMPILGPNCYGFVNLLDQVCLWPDQHGALPCERGVALLTQSSNIAINLTMQTRGLPIAYVITAGNQAQVSLPQLALEVIEDPRVTALGLHIEGFANLADWQALALRSVALGKPIIALKVGASEQAQAATVSHTASLAGSDAGATALMQRLGLARVETLASFLEALKLVHAFGALPSDQIASASCSGGEASLMADMGQAAGLSYPALTGCQISALSAALGPEVALANPLDYHTYIWGDVDKIEAMIAGLVADHLAMTVIVLDFPRPDRCSDVSWDLVVEAAARVRIKTGARIAILASLPETMPEGWAAKVFDAGLLPISGMAEGLAAIKAVASVAGVSIPSQPLIQPQAAVGEINLIPEDQAKTELVAAGVKAPQAQTVESVEALAGLDMPFPWVIKATGLAHKSDQGGVALDIGSLEEARAAYNAMPSQTVLVEPMIKDTVAELLVGVTLDPAHGFVLTVGAGGVMTELLQDTVSMLVPTCRKEVAGRMTTLKTHPLLTGYRGKPAADLDAVLDTIMAVQDYVVANQSNLLEVEINPVLATTTSAVAVDALIRKIAP